MKPVPAELQPALYDVNVQDIAHLVSFFFSAAWGGPKRWTSAPADTVFGGTTWSRGPVIAGEPRIDQRSGLEVSTLDVEIDPGAIELIAGKTIKVAALEGAFRKVRVLYQRAYFDATGTCVGVLTEFDGHVVKAPPSSTILPITARSLLAALTEQVPRRRIEVACPYKFGDPSTCKSTATGPCDHKLTTCRDTFDNAARFGGFPFVPSEEAA